MVRRGVVVVLAAVIAMAGGESFAQERGGGEPAEKVDRKPATHKKKRVHRKPRRARKPVPARGELEFVVKTMPRGAAVTIDGVAYGEAPVRVRARAGRRVIAARLRGYTPASTTIEVDRGLGYMVFSLARAPAAAKAAKPRRTGFGTGKLKHGEAVQKARFALKRGDHRAALRYAEAALASKPRDQEARMIATIAACGLGDADRARATLPRKRGSYREVSIKRCAGLNVELP